MKVKKQQTITIKKLPQKAIETFIFVLRGKKVMLDKDLSQFYGVPTKVLNQAVKRNKQRFPEDFMFKLTKAEMEILRSQIVTSRWGGQRYSSFAFTEQGVAMLSSVLSSKRAIQVNITIMRAFVKIREITQTNHSLLSRLRALEKKYKIHNKDIESHEKDLQLHEKDVQEIFLLIDKLQAEQEKASKKSSLITP